VFGGDDEYVPPPVKANYESLARRIAAAADASPGSNSVPWIVDGGNHALDNRCTDFVCTVMDFIEQKVLTVDESV
jgi:hypothetical protein